MLIDAQQLVHCSCFLAFLFILFNPQKQQQHANWPVNTILKLSVMATLFCASVHCGKAMLALYYRVNYWVMLLTEKEFVLLFVLSDDFLWEVTWRLVLQFLTVWRQSPRIVTRDQKKKKMQAHRQCTCLQLCNSWQLCKWLPCVKTMKHSITE